MTSREHCQQKDETYLIKLNTTNLVRSEKQSHFSTTQLFSNNKLVHQFTQFTRCALLINFLNTILNAIFRNNWNLKQLSTLKIFLIQKHLHFNILIFNSKVALVIKRIFLYTVLRCFNVFAPIVNRDFHLKFIE